MQTACGLGLGVATLENLVDQDSADVDAGLVHPTDLAIQGVAVDPQAPSRSRYIPAEFAHHRADRFELDLVQAATTPIEAIKFSGIAAQFRATKGPSWRGPEKWKARANSSLPAADSRAMPVCRAAARRPARRRGSQRLQGEGGAGAAIHELPSFEELLPRLEEA
ncbi:hypothetical protein [Thiocapsa rosea]|uniref:hypothetical protein n=1 Tax=Thiocapsa rosea TaxID=69360 RepID=UPI003CCC77A1